MGLLILFVGIALGVSFVCSLLEATLLSTKNAVLMRQSEEGLRGAGLLLALKRGHIDDAISAILILNTVSNTLGATMAGAQAAAVFGSRWVGLFSGVLTLGILVLSEIIPKTLGAVYPRQLGPTVGWILHGLTRAMLPLLLISRALTRWLSRGRETGISRDEIAAAISVATSQGEIDEEESLLLGNLLELHRVCVHDVMTPRTVVFTMPVESTIDDVLRRREAEVFSRIPLYKDDPDEIVGYVLKLDLLNALSAGESRTAPLARFVRQIDFVPELATIRQALPQVTQGRDPIAMVTDEHGAITGLITLEDLTETLLGIEIVDESDRIADMRELAAVIRDRRLERMRRKRQLPIDEPREAQA